MLNAQEQTRLYEFSHDVGRPSWEIETHTFLLDVSYPDASGAMDEAMAGDNIILRNIHPGMTIEHHFYPYTISTVIDYSEATDPLVVALNFSSPVEVEERSEGMLIISDGSGHELLSIVPSRPRDDTGMMGPAPTVSVTGEGNDRQVSVTIDDAWLRDTSRVFPVLLPIDYSLTPPSESMRAVRLMAIADQTVLYRDTRPDSATQFYVEFFDDFEFRRPRPQFEGKPTCSTVPTVLPSTVVSASAAHQTDVSREDANRYQNGNGYPTRTVWLRFIASKDVAATTPVYYDVDTPGTADFNGNIAEPAGSLDGLPMYRGSFDVNQASPPSSQDGLGRLHVYIREKRVKDMGCSMTVRGQRVEPLGSRATVLFGKACVWPLPLSAQVINFPKLRATVNVAGATAGVWGKGARVTVWQLQPERELLIDPAFRSSDLFGTNWASPIPYGAMMWESSGISPQPHIYDSPLAIGDGMNALPGWKVAPATMTYNNVPLFNPDIVSGVRIEVDISMLRQNPANGCEWTDGEWPAQGSLTVLFGGLGSGSGVYTATMSLLGPSNVLDIPAGTLAADIPATVYISAVSVALAPQYRVMRGMAYPFAEYEVDGYPYPVPAQISKLTKVSFTTFS